MRINFLFPFVVIVFLIVGCFLPWVTVETRGLSITGFNTAGTNFGKPGYFHIIWTGLCLVFLCFAKLWSNRAALVFAGFNMAWAIRNFFLLSACQMGDCPVRQLGLYLVFIASLLLFLSIMLLPAKQSTAI